MGILGALLGSGAAAFSQYFFQKKSLLSTRTFEEKKAAYLGFLDAYGSLCVNRNAHTENPNDKTAHKAAIDCTVWRAKINLVGSQTVREALPLLWDTAPDSPERENALNAIQNAMRKDLKIALS